MSCPSNPVKCVTTQLSRRKRIRHFVIENALAPPCISLSLRYCFFSEPTAMLTLFKMGIVARMEQDQELNWRINSKTARNTVRAKCRCIIVQYVQQKIFHITRDNIKYTQFAMFVTNREIGVVHQQIESLIFSPGVPSALVCILVATCETQKNQ